MSKYIPGNQKHLTLDDRKYIESELNKGPSLGFSTIIFGSNLMPVVSVTSIFAGFFISKKT